LKSTRPDVLFAIGKAVRYMTAPRCSHWLAAKIILRYLKGTMDYGIRYSGTDIDLQFAGHSDAYWDSSLIDNRFILLENRLQWNGSS
jgi:hypothetical protein